MEIFLRFLFVPVGSGAASAIFPQRGVIPAVKCNDDTSCVFPGAAVATMPTFRMSLVR